MSKTSESKTPEEIKYLSDLKELQQKLDNLRKEFSQKRKERPRYGLGMMMVLSVVVFAWIFTGALQLPIDISIISQSPLDPSTGNTSELAPVSISERFQVSMVLGISGGTLTAIVIAAARSQETQRKNDALAAISFDMRQARSDILSLRQRRLFTEGEWIKELKDRVDDIDKAKEHRKG